MKIVKTLITMAILYGRIMCIKLMTLLLFRRLILM